MQTKKIISIFSIFLVLIALFATVAMADNTERGNGLPAWVKPGAYATYFGDCDGISIKYSDKYYLFSPTLNSPYGDTNITWKIIAVSGTTVTIDMSIETKGLYYSSSYDLPTYVKKLFTATENNGTFTYHDEHTFKVNFLKREIVSNGGRVNLWINPAIDVTWDVKNVTSVQENPNAVPIAKYAGTKYIPKVMVFPTNNKFTHVHLYDPYIMTPMAKGSKEDLNIINKEQENMSQDNGSLSPYLNCIMYFERDLGILYMGNYLDDTLFTIFHEYRSFMIQLNHTNVNASASKPAQNPSMPSIEVIGTVIAIGALGVAAWILWRRKK